METPSGEAGRAMVAKVVGVATALAGAAMLISEMMAVAGATAMVGGTAGMLVR